ncbi:hypothetical protein [Schumannella soli]|uniref:TetR/AcrR family transcriptional regulator n=1 Tax=Schumannella soli TaxID=2590779 RepID=A0A506Y2N7_9MICO|nr:hypothetical protein [Schumannella soli]TPW75870.1 hypothetical protein FJ657_08415 [Schumannella soli]
MPAPALDDAIDAVVRMIIDDGFDRVDLRSVSRRLDCTEAELSEIVPTLEALVVRTLERETNQMIGAALDNISRDPNGGFLSRIYYYVLTSVYENELVRRLYLTDPRSLGRMVSAIDGFEFRPRTAIPEQLVIDLQNAGIVRHDSHPATVAAILTALSAGLALSAPTIDFDRAARGAEDALRTLVDADIVDTTRGKEIYHAYALELQTAFR